MTRPEFWQRWTAIINKWLARRRTLRINADQLRRDQEAGSCDAAELEMRATLYRGDGARLLVKGIEK